MKLIDIMFRGGFMMWPILACSVFAFAVALDRAFYFYNNFKISNKDFVLKLIEIIESEKIEKAVSYCEQTQIPFANICKSILINIGKNKNFIKEKAMESSMYEIPKMERNLSFLGTIAHVSPLMGLLGTVTGIIKSFGVIEEKSSLMGAVNPSDLAGGIMEALYTTAFGLLVAIPCFVVYNYFVNVINNKVTEMEIYAQELMLLLEEKGLIKE